MSAVRPDRILHDGLVLLGTGVLGTIAALVLAGVWDYSVYHRRSPGLVYAVVAADGTTPIGHAFITPGETSVNIGSLQVRQSWPQPWGGTIKPPAWALISPPPPWTAVGNEGLGWPARWLIHRNFVMHGPSGVAVSPGRWAAVHAPGLALDILLFGAVWIAGREAIMAAVRFKRLRGLHCPGCDYDLRGQVAPGCPECGWKRQPGPAAPAANPL